MDALDATVAGAAPAQPSEPAAGGEPVVPLIRVGRYTILRELGSGGMGEVYAAFDDQLDRKVALKVLRADQARGDERSARLLREAKAMARLSHPNVVAVHEIGEYRGRTFIAMEFVAGSTLDGWLAAAPRRWQDIVGVFVAAARGLQAAHEAGIIHRDFKPSNVMVGDDGRVRVLDFGIAGPQQDERRATIEELPDATPMPVSNPFAWQLTVEGAVLGTPKYMSPEQLIGRPLTPASDQFNFCVALYEALYSEHPFADEPLTLNTLRERIAGGEVREPPSARTRGAPGWLLTALRRGLRKRPEDRYSSMRELIAALDRDLTRRRRVVAPIALASFAAIVGYGASAVVQSGANRCDGGAVAISEVWSPARRADIAAAIRAAGLPFGEAVLASVTRELDDYAAAWAEMHRDACVAHRDGEQSGAMLDVRMTCLDRRRQAFGGALDLLAGADGAVVDGAVRLVGQLPRVAPCGDLASLASAVPPPDDPAAAVEVEALRRRLDAAGALTTVGRAEEALVIAREVGARGVALAFRPLTAEALLVEARTLLDFDGDREDVLRVLREAVVTAVAAGLDAEAAEALARRAYVVALELGYFDAALFDAAVARAHLDRLADPGPLLALLTNNIGAIHVAAEDGEQARARFEEALAILEGLPGDHALELSFTVANLAMQLAEGPRRRELLARMVELRRDKLGEGHPLTAHGEILGGLFTTDPRAAAALFERGCAAFDALPGDHLRHRRACRRYLGHALAEAGAHARAAAALAQALTLASAADPASPAERGFAALLTGASATVLVELRGTCDALRAKPVTSWWELLDRAEAELALALNLESADAAAEARERLTLVIPDLEQLAAKHHEVALRQHLAAARMARARLLVQGPADAPALDTARRDLGLAEAWYRDAGPGYAWRLGAVAELRARLGHPQ